ncbi:hypothetical protein ACN28I_16890 [Archangium gephyra]|uniref:hypothetical protein n=1 Tax=Archangium gephyra TaxID=48 RepID=UPI003B7EE8DF
MKSPFLVAVGGLLIVLGALIGIMTLLDERAFDAPILGVISVPAVLGLLLVMLGLRNPYAAAHRDVITRKATPKNFFVGLGIVLGSITTIYLFYNLIPVMPQLVVVGAMLGVPVGIFIMASLFAEACARCDRLLQHIRISAPQPRLERIVESLRSGDMDTALQLMAAQAPEHSPQLELAFCPSCQATAVCKTAKEPVVLRGASATQFISALPRLPHSRVD